MAKASLSVMYGRPSSSKTTPLYNIKIVDELSKYIVCPTCSYLTNLPDKYNGEVRIFLPSI